MAVRKTHTPHNEPMTETPATDAPAAVETQAEAVEASPPSTTVQKPVQKIHRTKPLFEKARDIATAYGDHAEAHPQTDGVVAFELPVQGLNPQAREIVMAAARNLRASDYEHPGGYMARDGNFYLLFDSKLTHKVDMDTLPSGAATRPSPIDMKDCAFPTELMLKEIGRLEGLVHHAMHTRKLNGSGKTRTVLKQLPEMGELSMIDIGLCDGPSGGRELSDKEFKPVFAIPDKEAHQGRRKVDFATYQQYCHKHPQMSHKALVHMKCGLLEVQVGDERLEAIMKALEGHDPDKGRTVN